MSKKLQKRLVSKGRYAWLMTERTTLTIGAVVSLCVGLTTLFGAAISLLDNPRNSLSTRFTVASEQFTPLRVVLFR